MHRFTLTALDPEENQGLKVFVKSRGPLTEWQEPDIDMQARARERAAKRVYTEKYDVSVSVSPRHTRDQ